MDFGVLMCETSEVSAALSCLVFPHEFSGSKLPKPHLPTQHYVQHREASKSKALLFPQLPELGHIAWPGSAVPALHSGYPQQADLPRLLPAEPGAASALCASTYVQKEEFSAGRRKTGALTLKELYKPLHKLHPAS